MTTKTKTINLEIMLGDIYLNTKSKTQESPKAVIVLDVVNTGKGVKVLVRDMLAPSIVDGKEKSDMAYEIDAFSLTMSGEKITKTQYADLAYNYFVKRHLDLAKKACDHADKPTKGPKFPFTTPKEIMVEWTRIGKVIDNNEDDEQAKHFVGLFNIEGEDKKELLSLLVKSLLEPKEYDLQLAEFLFTRQKEIV